MTKQQLALYRESNIGFYNKALTSAGIKLSFKTDSQSLKLDLTLQSVMARTYAAVEVYVNGVRIDSIHEIEEYVRQVTASYDNITVIRGFELIPHESGYFGDMFLHPSDEGFAHYGKNLIRSLWDCGFLHV